MNMRAIPLLLAMALGAGGCSMALSDIYPWKSNIYPGEQDRNLPPAAHERVVKSERPSDNSAKYRVYDVSIPVHDGSGVVSEVEFSESKRPGKKPVVVTLSVYGSALSPEYPPRTMAKRLTLENEKADYNVAVIREKGDLFEWDALAQAKTIEELRFLFAKSVQRNLQAIREVQTVLDWAESEPSVDTSRIGIVGFSLGCMVAVNTMGIDWRISAGAFIMCGGNFPEILMSSEAGFIRRVRENAMLRLGMTRDEFKNMSTDILSWIEPNTFARHIPPDRALLVDAKFDSFLPWWSRESLQQALRRPGRDPLRIILHYDHKMAFLAMTPLRDNYLDKRIAAFFREKLF